MCASGIIRPEEFRDVFFTKQHLTKKGWAFGYELGTTVKYSVALST